MANRHRGEIDATLDGRTFKLCLTLGALAELETAFEDSDMLALAKRFESGRLRAVDAIRVIGAGLRGAGHDIDDAAVARLAADGGAAGFVGIVAALLQATFGGAQTPSSARPASAPTPAEAGRADPFPGPR